MGFSRQEYWSGLHSLLQLYKNIVSSNIELNQTSLRVLQGPGFSLWSGSKGPTCHGVPESAHSGACMSRLESWCTMIKDPAWYNKDDLCCKKDLIQPNKYINIYFLNIELKQKVWDTGCLIWGDDHDWKINWCKFTAPVRTTIGTGLHEDFPGMKPAQNINEMKEQASKTFWGGAMKTVQRLSDARWHGLFEEQQEGIVTRAEWMKRRGIGNETGGLVRQARMCRLVWILFEEGSSTGEGPVRYTKSRPDH